MKTEIDYAIYTSIAHNKIVSIYVKSLADAITRIAEITRGEFDWVKENDGAIDIWGNRNATDFRIKLIADHTGKAN